MAIPCFCVKNLTKKPAWKNRQAEASLCNLILTAADPWQKLHLWRAQRSKELDYTNGKTLRKIFSPHLCAQRELPGSYKIHYSDSSQIFLSGYLSVAMASHSNKICPHCENLHPSSSIPCLLGFGYVQWMELHFTLPDLSQIQTLLIPSILALKFS